MQNDVLVAGIFRRRVYTAHNGVPRSGAIRVLEQFPAGPLHGALQPSLVAVEAAQDERTVPDQEVFHLGLVIHEPGPGLYAAGDGFRDGQPGLLTGGIDANGALVQPHTAPPEPEAGRLCRRRCVRPIRKHHVIVIRSAYNATVSLWTYLTYVALMGNGRPDAFSSTLLDAITDRAIDEPDRTAFEFADDHHAVSRLTCAELAHAVEGMAARLAQAAAPGGRAVLLYPPGLDYIVALLAAMSAGVAAVPAYPPSSPRHLGRLRALLSSCDAQVVLASEHFDDVAAQFADARASTGSPVRWLLGTAGSPDSGGRPAPAADDVALIQYTSGSTSAPRGVVLTHRQILSNLRMIEGAFGVSRDDLAVLWLPPYHDMGLIGGILAPLWIGFGVRLMSPLSFIRDPLGWLDQISALGATIAGGPNFAFERCTRRLAHDRRPLDLGSWRVAFVGAEPVRAATLARFAAAFQPYGFREQAFYPCYGLAEATLMATGGTRGGGAVVRAFSRGGLAGGRARAPDGPGDRQEMVSGGRAVPGLALRITDESGQSLPPGSVGEIRLSGPSVASGYFGGTGASAGTRFVAGGDRWEVATRDLGFLDGDGELFVCGRVTEMIILGGRNVHPEDVELVAEEALPHPGPAIAFGIDAGSEERLIVLREARGLGSGEKGPAAARIRARLGQIFGLQPAAVVLVPGGELPRTSSGKVQRGEARRLFLEGHFGTSAEIAETAGPQGEPGPEEGPVLAALRDSVARALGVPVASVAVTEPATAAGLDSMGAAAVAEELEWRHGFVLPGDGLLSGASLRQLAARAEPATDGFGEYGGEPAAEASYGERAVWLHERLGEGPSPYVLPVALDLGAEVDREALEQALRDVVTRNPSLRTAWVAENGVLRRRVADQADPRLLVDRQAASGEAELRAALETASRRPLRPDVAGGSLRATLLGAGQDRWILYLAVHHLAADHWALQLLVADLGRCYAARVAGGAPPATTVTDMGDLIRQEQRMLSAPEGARMLASWVSPLRDAPPPAPLPGSRSRAGRLRFDARTVPVPVQPRTAAMLRALARSEGTTPFVVLAAALHVLLARLTGQRDIVIGTAASRRTSPPRRRAAGLLMNTMPLRAAISGSRSFREVVRDEHEVVAAARAGQDVPFIRVVEALGRSGESSPLYTTMLTMLDRPPGRVVPGTRWEVIELPQPGVAVDVAFDVRHGADAIAIDMRYARQALTDDDAERVALRFSRLLEQVLAVPDRPVSAAPLTDPAERRRLLALGEPHAAEPPPGDVFARFAEHASRVPSAVAVHAHAGDVSYATLYRQACALAGELREVNAHAVGVLLPRSPALIVAVLASLAAQVPWVPIEPGTPAARVQAMLTTAGVDLLITDQAPPSGLGRRVRVIRPGPGRAQLEPSPAHPRGMAYVMFTSGSTGRPKGVMAERRSLSATLNAVASLDPVASRQRMLAVTSVGFDISVLELLLPLVMGASVVLAGRDGVRDPAGLLELITRARVDLLQGTPSTLTLLLDAGMRLDDVTVLCGGEAAPHGLFRRLREAGADPLNVYGPTETVIWSTARHARDDDDPPLGRPLAGESVYVLDGAWDVAPLEVEGELCIGGAGVARGYAGQPGLTAERFVPDPFSAVPGARMYRTGDLACFDHAGQLRFRGRRDRQVKIRGARVECAEVELVLQAHSAIRRAAVVVADGAAGPALLAAVQWQAGQHASDSELRAFLSARLPPQAVPSVFREVAEMPVTERGKLDARALSRGLPLDGGRPLSAPATPVEAALAEIWRGLLGADTIGRFDEFFALGGHSLHAVGVVARVAEELGRRITVADVLQAPRLERLARRVEQAARISGRDTPVPSGTLGDAQRRLWVFEQLHPGTPAANISLAVRAEGPLDVTALHRAVNTLLERHAELRACFPADERGRPVRRVEPPRPIVLEVATAPAGEGMSRLHGEILRPFGIEHGPLTRLTLVRTGPEDHLLAFTIHHLVADVSAAGVLAREASELYRAFAAGAEPPSLGTPADYAGLVALMAADRDPQRDEQDLAWWRQALAGAPRRVFGPAQPGARAGVETDVLAGASVRALRDYAAGRGVTPFMVAAAVLAWVLATRTGQQDIVLGADVSGRDEPGAADAVGPLVNQIGLRFDTAAATLPGLVTQARSRVTEALSRSRVSYDRVVAAVTPSKAERALFDVKLAYQPAVEEQLILEGLRLTAVPRAPVPPAEAFVLFVRERPRELLVELQHRYDAVDSAGARDLLRAFLEGLSTLATCDGSAAPDRPASGTGFRRRVARTVEVTAPGSDVRLDASDPSAPPAFLAAPGAVLPTWLAGNRQRVDEALAAHGALVFRGFGVREPGMLQDVVGAAGEPPYLSTEHNRTSLAANVFTPIPYSSRERLLWHNEDAFRPEWPSHLWFACARPADQGGETTVADSRAAMASLGDTGRRLAREGVMYVRRFGEGLGQSWQNVFQTSDRAEVEARCRAQGIAASWDNGRLVTRTVLPATRRHPVTGEECWIAQLLHFHPAALPEQARSSLTALYGEEGLPRDCRHAEGSPIADSAVLALIAGYEATERACRWQSGDVLLVDNILAAHGRRPYSGERALLVAMTGAIAHDRR